jgi:phage terminase large subunit GpA-like protein
MEALLAEFEEPSAELARDLLREYLAPPPRLTVTEWAERHRRLSGTESAEPGPYRVSRTPYAREPQDAMSARSPVEEVVLQWAAQTGKTNLMLNCIGAAIDMNPGPMMIVWPTNTVAKRNSRQRIAPLLNESPKLAAKVAANRSRDKANTTLLKEFDGGIMVIAGANSAADLRSTPVRDLYLDEIDNFPLDVDGEGDPSKLAEARQTTFARKKRLRTSTPTTKDFSRVEAAYMASDRCRYHVPCPHCGAYQPLEFGADLQHGLKWDKDETGRPLPHTVRYVCKANGCEIREHHKKAMLPSGVWISENPGAQSGKVRGFHLSGLYSPLGWLSWRTIAVEFYEAMEAVRRGDVSLLRVFVNTRLAETFEEQGDKANVHELRKRADPDLPLRVVAWDHYVMTIGVDVQIDHLHLGLWAWGRGMRRQLVDRHVIHGDPAKPEDDPESPWAALTEYLRTPVMHASGAAVPLLATLIDTGNGNHTQAIYAYCRNHQAEKVMATKGQSQAGKPILGRPTMQEVNWRGVKLKRGVKLWPVGSDTAKSEIYGRLRVAQPGPGFVLMSKLLPGDVFDQITAERLVTRYVKGRPKSEWVLPNGRRNEDLDCAVYALAGAHWAGLDRWRDSDWARREADVQASSEPPPQKKIAISGGTGRLSLSGLKRFGGSS